MKHWLWRIPILLGGTWLMYHWGVTDDDAMPGAGYVMAGVWIVFVLGLWGAKAHDERALAEMAERHEFTQSARHGTPEPTWVTSGYADTEALIERIAIELETPEQRAERVAREAQYAALSAARAPAIHAIAQSRAYADGGMILAGNPIGDLTVDEIRAWGKPEPVRHVVSSPGFAEWE